MNRYRLEDDITLLEDIHDALKTVLHRLHDLSQTRTSLFKWTGFPLLMTLKAFREGGIRRLRHRHTKAFGMPVRRAISLSVKEVRTGGVPGFRCPGCGLGGV